MNNKSKILVCSLALLLVVSIGYALFGENININGSATASGDMKVEVLECQPGLSNEYVTINNKIDPNYPVETNSGQGGYSSNEFCRVDQNDKTKIKFSTELLYPTAIRFFTVKVRNNSDFPVKYVDYNMTSKTYIDGYNDDTLEFKPGDGVLTEIEHVKNADNNAPADFIEDGSFFNEKYFHENSVLNPGEDAYLLFGVFFPEGKTGSAGNEIRWDIFYALMSQGLHNDNTWDVNMHHNIDINVNFTQNTN